MKPFGELNFENISNHSKQHRVFILDETWLLILCLPILITDIFRVRVNDGVSEKSRFIVRLWMLENLRIGEFVIRSLLGSWLTLLPFTNVKWNVYRLLNDTKSHHFYFIRGFVEASSFSCATRSLFFPGEKLFKRTENDEKIEISIYFNCLIDAERQGRRKMKRSIAKFIHHSFHSYRSIKWLQFGRRGKAVFMRFCILNIWQWKFMKIYSKSSRKSFKI